MLVLWLSCVGLIPAKLDSEPSVFSRLDIESSSLTRRPPVVRTSTPRTTGSPKQPRQRVIHLSTTPNNAGLYSDQVASGRTSIKQRIVPVRTMSGSAITSPPKRKVISVKQVGTLYSDSLDDEAALPVKKHAIATSRAPRLSSHLTSTRRMLQQRPATVSVRGKMASDAPAQTLSMRLGGSSQVKSAQVKSRLSSSTVISSSGVGRVRTKRMQRSDPLVASNFSNKTGVFGYNELEADMETGSPQELEGSSWKIAGSGGARSRPSTMVADEYEYQTLRQQDIRSRLERREQEKTARRGGPLAGRLGTHEVFMRLE